ncbi:hypothetical protein [Rhizobium bangladeshense]|uniref:hypothetical protein n=1 Tax=Rhizobium bangladeshense TaxID=1138189 RepID=UPI0012E8A729|nr:hypothetical protein [Rhizobium bangladeshense]
MLLNRIKEKRDAIKTIGVDAAEQAASLGIEPVTVVLPELKRIPIFGRVIAAPERLSKAAPKVTGRRSRKLIVQVDKKL